MDTELQTISDIESTSAAFVKEHLKLGSAPEPVKPTMEDEQGNRVVRYSIATRRGPYDQHFTETIVSRDGKVLSLRVQKIFVCIAEGTNIATPDGPRSVQELAVGDAVLAFDVATGRRHVTKVQAVWQSFSEQLVQVADDLVVTGRHPIYADGRWIEASDLRAGTRLLGIDNRATVAAPRPIGGGRRVYDLSVGWPHTYFAGEILVHNKAAQSPESNSVRTDLEYRPTPRPKK